jgi:hypothetical protein
MRQFYVHWPIAQTVSAQLSTAGIAQTLSAKLGEEIFHSLSGKLAESTPGSAWQPWQRVATDSK